jgi:hypothetical protein
MKDSKDADQKKAASQLGKLIKNMNKNSSDSNGDALDVDRRSQRDGETLMTLAGRYKQNSCMRLLVKEFGANVNAVDANGWSPLMECAAYTNGRENLAGVAYLVQNGADPWLKGKSTAPLHNSLVTAKHVAIQMKNPVVFSYLHSIGRPITGVAEANEDCAVCTEAGGDIMLCSNCPRWYHFDCIAATKSDVSHLPRHTPPVDVETVLTVLCSSASLLPYLSGDQQRVDLPDLRRRAQRVTEDAQALRMQRGCGRSHGCVCSGELHHRGPLPSHLHAAVQHRGGKAPLTQ